MKDLVVVLVILITVVLTYKLFQDHSRVDKFVNDMPTDIEDILGDGVSMSIMERRGDQGYFSTVAAHTKTKNSQFDQTITQASLL